MSSQEKIESPMRSAQLLQQTDSSPASNEAYIASVMNRLASPKFPAEMLLQVVEATVISQVRHWKVTYSHKLDALAASLFARPKGVTTATLRVLQQTVETVLLNRGIVRIAADLKYRCPPTYQIPPALRGREDHVKHLVLDLEIVAHTFSHVLSAGIDHNLVK